MGPYEVLSRVPRVQIDFLALSQRPVHSEGGLALQPTITLDQVTELDVLCIPGGPGVNAVLAQDEVLQPLARIGAAAKLVTSVCSGALILGCAGLLRGYRATTHWRYLELLPLFGATPIAERVVRDRDRITAAGVSAGIDFALTLAAELADERTARQIQLMIEYDPQPPFDAGSPQRARPAEVSEFREATSEQYERRRALIESNQQRR